MEAEQIKLPPAFVERMKRMLGEEWEAFEQCYLNDRYQGLRFNPLKAGTAQKKHKELLQALQIDISESVSWAANGYYYEEKDRPGKHAYHEAGLYYIQEPSAMSAAALLAPVPGERVLDLCAAPGGKTTQLAGFLNQEGLLVANEIHPARCKILSQNVERMGIRNAIVTNEDSGYLADCFPEFFHKILVDAPCSGEGMFRKLPEACEEWSAEQVQVCAERQLEILENAAKMLMPGGKMCYSTCTFAPEENEGVIGAFLEKHQEFSVVKAEAPYFEAGHPEWGNGNEDLKYTFRLWPHKLHGEGHYAALLEKTGELPETDIQVKQKIKEFKDKKMLSVLEEFVSQMFTKEMAKWILKGPFTLFGEQLYRLPQGSPSLERMKVLRPGLHLGTFKKNRFEPSHALALAMKAEDVKCSVMLDAKAEETGKYYNGESLDCDNQKGWCLVCVDGFSAGWGKAAGGQLKNHYPKGLRKKVL